MKECLSLDRSIEMNSKKFRYLRQQAPPPVDFKNLIEYHHHYFAHFMVSTFTLTMYSILSPWTNRLRCCFSHKSSHLWETIQFTKCLRKNWHVRNSPEAVKVVDRRALHLLYILYTKKACHFLIIFFTTLHPPFKTIVLLLSQPRKCK